MTDNSYLAGYHILLIGSGDAFRREITRALSGERFLVSGMADYREALAKLAELKADMVILDRDLPALDSREACRRLRGAGIPVMLLGDDTGDEVWAELMRAHADFYLKRPFSGLELAARIRAILRRYRRYETLSRLN